MRYPIALALLAFLTLGSTAQDAKDKPAKKDKPVAADKDLLAGIEDKKPVQGAADNKYEYAAYCYLVLHAAEVAPEALAKAARKDLSIAKLMADPAKYRGEPMQIKGRLRRLVKMDAPKGLLNDNIKVLYEGWFFPENEETTPYCVIFTEIPKGIELGEKTFYRANCDAYFFKIYRYKAVNNTTRDAPLLIGRTFALATD